MPVFSRRVPAPHLTGNYVRYRAFVREDFSECCAYCLFHELIAAGPANFELDHFRPKSRPEFALLVNDFFNLYYSCHVCNHYKGNAWPSKQLEELGYGYVDLCREMFSAHFLDEEDGSWRPLTRLGEYTAAQLRLNRQHLREIRRHLRELAEQKGRAPLDWNYPCKSSLLQIIE